MRTVTVRASIATGARLTAIALLLVASGCSSAPEASSPAASSTASGAAATDSSAPPESTSHSLNAGSAPTAPVTAKVVKVDVSKESVMYFHVMIDFENKNDHPCKVTSYAIQWPGGSKEIKKEFSIPTKDSIERSMKVDDNDGKTDSLKPEAVTVSLKSDCGPT
jgi:hypothetical protein